jgi:hypothetical protein
MITKQKFLDLLKTLDPDPNFKVLIIQTLMEELPSSVSWELSHALYLKYFYDGPLYSIKSNLNGKTRVFASYDDVSNYLKALGYDTNATQVKAAFYRRAPKYCNHEFINTGSNKKEIIYYE